MTIQECCDRYNINRNQIAHAFGIDPKRFAHYDKTHFIVQNTVNQTMTLQKHYTVANSVKFTDFEVVTFEQSAKEGK